MITIMIMNNICTKMCFLRLHPRSHKLACLYICGRIDSDDEEESPWIEPIKELGSPRVDTSEGE